MHVRESVSGVVVAVLMTTSALAANSVVIESKTVQPGETGVTIGVFMENDDFLVAVALPFEIRTVTGSAFISDNAVFQVNPLGRVSGSSLEDFVVSIYYGRKSENLDPFLNSCGPVAYAEGSGSPDIESEFYISPDAIMFVAFTTFSPAFPPGSDGALPSFSLIADVSTEQGIFEVDTICTYPGNNIGFSVANQMPLPPITPSFTKGVITVAGGGDQEQCPTLYTFTGEAADDLFGTSVAGAGDVDNDGYADLIVGAFLNDAGGSDAGRADVFSGQTGSLLWTFTGEAADDLFGTSVAGAGDVDNDGYADLIVGAAFIGRAYVYSGQTGTVQWTFTEEVPDDILGWSVAGAGDVDNDGWADLIVGAPGNDAGGDQAGRAYVYSGLTGTMLWTFTGEAEGDFCGVSVAGAGDVDNDGFADLIVGASGNDAGGDQAGRAYVYSGRTGTMLWTFTGEAEGDFCGGSVAGAGDVDHDDYADLIVGSVGNDAAGDGAGRAYVYSGRTGTLLWTFTGEAAGDFFGKSVAGADDVDHDGYADLIVGAIGVDQAYVYSGLTGALLGSPTGEAAGDGFGRSVSGAGDVNNDGYADLIVGARGNDAGGGNAGRAYVFTCISQDQLVVALDVKPGSCPNPLNVSRNWDRPNGVLPVAILGEAEFDVTMIDPESVRLEGVAPLRSIMNDVGTPLAADAAPCDCHARAGDGFVDLTLHFSKREIISALIPVADGEEVTFTVTGTLIDGTVFRGSDCVVIRARGCHADPRCDGVTDVLDVVLAAGVSFRSEDAIIDSVSVCPGSTTDVDCDGDTDILDVIRFVNVAFRNEDPAVQFCDPCTRQAG